MCIPIAITTYNRTEYLKRTLKSLENSYANLENLVIVDDCSKNEKHVAYLRKLNYTIVLNDSNLGTFKNTIKAVNLAFEKNKESNYIVYAQDDILFSKNWLYDSIALFESIPKDERIAYLNLCDRNSKEKPTHLGYEILKIGHHGALCWLISKKFWEKFIKNCEDKNGIEFFGANQAKKTYMQKHICDKKITEYARELGYKVAKVTGCSLVNHIGNKSSLHDNDMSMWSSKNFVGEE